MHTIFHMDIDLNPEMNLFYSGAFIIILYFKKKIF